MKNKNKVKYNLSALYNLYEDNLAKIIFVIFLHVAVSFIVALPYINIFASLIDFLPFIIDWIAIALLFKPSPKFVFWMGVSVLLLSYPFLLLDLSEPGNILGTISYLMFATYIILTIDILKNK